MLKYPDQCSSSKRKGKLSLILCLITWTLLLSLILLMNPGCALPKVGKAAIRADWEQALQDNNKQAYQAFLTKYPKSGYQSLAEAQIRKLTTQENTEKNWDKLKAGMSVAEVDALVGPFPPEFVRIMAKRKRQFGGAADNTTDNDYKYYAGYYTLVFDRFSNLKQWQRHPDHEAR